MRVERFPVFAPVALAGIAGGMPSTITTRAITIHMRRRAPHEHAEPFRERRVESEAAPLREALAEWLDRDGADYLAGAEPAIPDGVTDRAAEVWEPLLAVAELAGGHWPDTARAAASHFVTAAGSAGASIGTRLLADLHALFRDREVDRMETTDILAGLHDADEAPWGDLDGRPLDARRLAAEMRRYGVRPKDLKLTGGAVRKGYRADGSEGLADAWLRYLPVAATAATAATAQVRQVAAEVPVADVAATAPPNGPTAPCRADDSTAFQQRPLDQDRVAEVADTAATTRSSATTLTRPVAAVAAVADVEGRGGDA